MNENQMKELYALINPDEEGVPPRDTIIRYKGGGYDGCFWEPNYAFYNAHRKFYDLLSSGSYAAHTEEQLLERVTDQYGFCDVFPIYHRQGQLKLATDLNASHLLAVAEKMREKYDADLIFKCKACGKIKECVEGIGDDHEGQGGICILATSIICDDCNYERTCPVCGEHFDTPAEAEYDKEGRCKVCRERDYEDVIAVEGEHLVSCTSDVTDLQLPLLSEED